MRMDSLQLDISQIALYVERITQVVDVPNQFPGNLVGHVKILQDLLCAFGHEVR